jgi:hypothetical protein
LAPRATIFSTPSRYSRDCKITIISSYVEVTKALERVKEGAVIYRELTPSEKDGAAHSSCFRTPSDMKRMFCTALSSLSFGEGRLGIMLRAAK